MKDSPCAYERIRARNIERNNARLTSLGLFKKEAPRKRPRSAAAKSQSTPTTAATTNNKRTSRRLQGLQPDGRALPPTPPPKPQERPYKSPTLDQSTAAQENRTATYEHCRMRIRTMSHKALGRRITVMERAAGKHSLVKLQIFRDCLEECGLDELAEEARQAGERMTTPGSS